MLCVGYTGQRGGNHPVILGSARCAYESVLTHDGLHLFQQVHAEHVHHPALKVILVVRQHTLFGAAGGQVPHAVARATEVVIPAPEIVLHVAQYVHQVFAHDVAHACCCPAQRSDFVNDRLPRAVDFQVESGVLVGSGKVSNHPSKLVGVHLAGSKLCHLV